MFYFKIIGTLFLLVPMVFIISAKTAFSAPCGGGTAAILGVCSSAGQWEYDSSNSTYRYCNGTNLINATEIVGGTVGVLTTSSDKLWNWSGTTLPAYGPIDSGTYAENKTLTIENTGSCDVTITDVSVSPATSCFYVVPFSDFICDATRATGFAINTTTTCSGVLTVGSTCTIELLGSITLPPGGLVSVGGVLEFSTSNGPITITTSITGCDQVGIDANLCI
jgi:hypothetical protein